MSSPVLDASAILALVNDEPGAEEVQKILPNAAVSAVNFSEVFGKLSEIGMPEEDIAGALDGLGLIVHDFGRADARVAGLLRPVTKKLGLSLGDRACLALAIRLGVPALTTEKTWRSLNLEVKIQVVR
ncbi:MAG: type II toxin-antitoxin system VapC family toxin [Vicinamibacteria bacterium]